jgi:hypothetical protein
MRKTLGVLTAAALMLPVGLTAIAPAGSAAALPTCNAAKGTFKFTPALQLKTTAKGGVLSSAGTLASCSGGGVTAGKTVFKSPKGTTASGCSTLIKPDPKSKGTIGAFTITWSNKKTSTAKTFAIKQTAALVDATTIGKITSGLFVGKTIKGTVTFTLNKGGCSTVPATGGTYINKKATKFTIS